MVGKQVVGVGDEVVTTRNDRRLVTNTGAWVRNGDRWRVVARRADGSLLLGSLDGRGKVSIPIDYVRDNVALAYAVTVHKAQGLTTDEAVLVVDEATSAEHLYVGLTRGREQNLACVACEPVDDGHRRLPAPSAHDVLTAALGRIGSDGSATEAFRAGLAQAADTSTIRAVLAEALRRVDALAGPDRSQEIERLRQEVARHANEAGGAGEVERLRTFWLLNSPGPTGSRPTRRSSPTSTTSRSGSEKRPSRDPWRSKPANRRGVPISGSWS